MSKALLVSGVFILIALVGYILTSNKRNESDSSPQQEITLQQVKTAPSQTQAVDHQASFAIFTNGTFRPFTASKYHNLSPDAYIESSNPNIVKVKKTGITWGDFFQTLPFSLTDDCLTTGTRETFCTGSKGTLKFYLNGVQQEKILGQEIQNNDQLLVTFGNEFETVIKEQFDQIPNP